MKYTIMGFQQQKLIDNNLTVEDAFVLRVIKDMFSSASMEFKDINGQRYMWINYTYLLEQIPIVGTKRNLMRKIEKYGNDLLLLRVLENNRKGVKGNYSYIAPTEKLDSLQDYNLMPKSHDLMTESHKGYDKSVIRVMSKSHNKDTSIIDTSIIDTSIKDTNNILSSSNDIASRTDIINYLNSKTNKHYKPNTSKTKTVIGARLKEGFTIDDFKIVIDKKSKQWLGNDMDKYLRPETLFGTKFESYLNESETNTANNTSSKQTIDQSEIDAFLKGDY